MNEQTHLQHQGWWNSFKENLSLDQLSKKFDFSLNNLIEVSAYLVIGFISGFLIKKYGRFVIVILLVAGLSMGVLAHFNVITIDWVKIKMLLGISEIHTLDNVRQVYSAWIKEHIVAIISVIIGFLIGHRAGC